MNFFEHQDRARRNSGWLVVLLLLAVASLILITTTVLAGFIYYVQFRSDQYVQAHESGISIFELAVQVLSPELVGSVSLAVVAVVALGSLFKWLQLSQGGKAVAEALGGRLLNTASRDTLERQALNVVEEMAIASGTPVPPLYLIDDPAINAFAAGHSPHDAVIGVTRGCLSQLNRDQFQGVIAHEFSHILHGDMRLNLRLVGILHGILVIGLIGELITRSSTHRRQLSSRRNNNQGTFVLGLALMAIGYAGTFFGNLIKAAVSRQREFLADASAVQFTRNPGGIAGALKKIGGYPQGSMLVSANAAEYSHLYFGEGVKNMFSRLMATHPPLRERIIRIDPTWPGRFFSPEQSAPMTDTPQPETASNLATATSAASAPLQPSVMDTIGQPDEAHIDQAQQLLTNLDTTLRDAARDPFSARALVYSLLLAKPVNRREQQLQALREKAHPVVFNLVENLSQAVQHLAKSLHLPLLELCLPALKTLSEPQYQVFKRNLALLIRADDKVELFEWSLYRIVTHHVEKPLRLRYGSHRIKQQATACQLLLSMLAHSGQDSPARAAEAFSLATQALGLPHLQLLDRELLSLPKLDRALQALNQLKPLQKPILLKSMALCVMHDGEVKPVEAELFRAVADSLECPVPPLLPGQALI